MKNPILAVTLLLLVTGAAQAQVPRLISHQGDLTSGGLPVPDGDYPMTFRIYDAPVGGAALHTETQPAVVVRGGVFSVILGVFEPLTLAFDVPCWLGVQVGSDPEMSPRVALTSAPYALSLALPFEGSLPSPSPVLPAVQIVGDGPGEALRVTGAVEAGIRDGLRAEIRSFPGEGTRALVADGTTEYGFMRLEEGAGPQLALFDDPVSMTGAFLDCPLTGAGEPTLTLNGTGGVVQLGVLAEDNVLPPESLSPDALLDEAGVASRSAPTQQALTSSLMVLDSITIMCPSAGYVLAIGTCQTLVQHDAGGTSSAIFGVSDNPAQLPQNQDVAVRLETGFPSGNYIFPVQVHRLFNAVEGPTTFYLLGQEGSANHYQAGRAKLSAVYLPSAYGVIAAASAGAEPGADTPAAVNHPQSGAGATDLEQAAVRLTQARATDERNMHLERLKQAKEAAAERATRLRSHARGEGRR